MSLAKIHFTKEDMIIARSKPDPSDFWEKVDLRTYDPADYTDEENTQIEEAIDEMKEHDEELDYVMIDNKDYDGSKTIDARDVYGSDDNEGFQMDPDLHLWEDE